MSVFDYVFVWVMIVGKVYWLDGIWMGDVLFDWLRVLVFGWGLLLVVKDVVFVWMMLILFDVLMIDIVICIDVIGGFMMFVLVKIEWVVCGDEVIGLGVVLVGLSGDVCDWVLCDFWKG